MGSNLFYDDYILTITKQTSRKAQSVQRIPVYTVTRFDYKRPTLMKSGTLQFFMEDGSSTEVLEVHKKNRALFDELVSELEVDLRVAETFRTSPQRASIEAEEDSGPVYRQGNAPSEAGLLPGVISTLRKSVKPFAREAEQPEPEGFETFPFLARNEFVAIDLEWTDGKNFSSVCEIGLAKFVNNELTESFGEYVRPTKKFRMGERESKTHGIPIGVIQSAKTLDELWPSINDFIDGRPLIAHNATNDVNRMLASLSAEIRATVPNLAYLDTLQIAKKLPWITAKNNTLKELTRVLEIELERAKYDGRDKFPEAHGAREDASAAGQLLLKMMEMVGYKSLVGFAELVGIWPGQIAGGKVIQSPSAAGKIKWPHLNEIPDEESLVKDLENKRASHEKTVDRRESAEQIKNKFLEQDPVPWSTLTVGSGSKVYFSTFPMEVQEEIEKVARLLGVDTSKFSAKIDLLVVADSAVRDSARLRNALGFKNPVPVTNYSNFLANNPDFPKHP